MFVLAAGRAFRYSPRSTIKGCVAYGVPRSIGGLRSLRIPKWRNCGLPLQSLAEEIVLQ